MITAVTVNGQPLDPCHILAAATVLHGRAQFGDPGQASSAQIVVEYPHGPMPAWQSGDTLTIDTPEGVLFSGRIVERSLAHLINNDGTRTGQFTVTAAGPLAALGIRMVGDVPWPQEAGTARADKILTAAAVPYRIEGSPELQVLARDVDAQPALGLLDELAESTGATVFDTPDGHVVYQTMQERSRPVEAFMWQDFPGGVFNLLTADQASVETSAAGWQNANGADVARVVGPASHGTASLSATSTAVDFIQVQTATQVPVAPNTPYTICADLSAPVIRLPVALRIIWYKSDGNFSDYSVVSESPYVPLTGTFAQRMLTATSPPDAAYARPRYAYWSAAAGEVVHSDRWGFWLGAGGEWALPDPGNTWDDFHPDLTWEGLEGWQSPSSTWPVVLPCDTVVWEPEWHSSEGAVINHVRIGYGAAEPQAFVDLTDAASIAQHGARYLYQGTQLVGTVDANVRASHIVTTQAVERWEIGDVVVALDRLDAATYGAVFDLLCGDPVTLQGLPQPAPATDWTGILEGWTYTMDGAGGALSESMTLALSDPLQSLMVMTWDDYPAAYEWQQHPAHLTWFDLDSIDVLEAV